MPIAGRGEPEVFGPQTGHRLAHCTDGVFHCSRSNGLTIFGKSAIPVTLGEDLEVWDLVGDVCQKGVNFVFGAEVQPDCPGVILGGGTFSTVCVATGFRSNAKVNAECMGFLRVTSFQGID